MKLNVVNETMSMVNESSVPSTVTSRIGMMIEQVIPDTQVKFESDDTHDQEEWHYSVLSNQAATEEMYNAVVAKLTTELTLIDDDVVTTLAGTVEDTGVVVTVELDSDADAFHVYVRLSAGEFDEFLADSE